MHHNFPMLEFHTKQSFSVKRLDLFTVDLLIRQQQIINFLIVVITPTFCMVLNCSVKYVALSLTLFFCADSKTSLQNWNSSVGVRIPAEGAMLFQLNPVLQ